MGAAGRSALPLRLLEFGGALDTVRCVRESLEAHLGNLGVTFDAQTIDTFFDALKSGFDLAQRLLIVFHEAEREFLFEIVGTDIRHVNGHTREIAAGLAASFLQSGIRHRADVTAEASP